MRKFLSSLDDSGKYYYVVRSMRVTNEKVKAPTATDAQFSTDEAEAAADGAAPAGDPFGGGGGFVLPGDEPAAPAEDAAAEPAADAAPAAPAEGSDELILKQVLGSEKINAFLRIDIIQFFDATKAAPGQP